MTKLPIPPHFVFSGLDNTSFNGSGPRAAMLELQERSILKPAIILSRTPPDTRKTTNTPEIMRKLARFVQTTNTVMSLNAMKRKKRQPDAAAGGLAVAMGVGCFAIALFSSLSAGQRYSAAASGCMGLSWGLKEVAAAKKWKQEPEEEHYATTAKEIKESKQEEKMEKSGSMHNVFVLFAWIFLFLAIVGAIGVGYLFMFHRKH